MPTDVPRIIAVIFDLDDTLYPERAYVHSGYRAVGRYLREQLTGGEVFEDWLWLRFCSGKAGGAFDALNEEFQLELSPNQIAELVTVYRRHVPEIRPFEGVEKLLERLSEKYRLGLLSDGFLPAQRLKLDALQLERFFNAVVFTEEIGREFWKPSPAGFEKISKMLDAPYPGCAYVADNPAKDFVAPNSLGWQTIQLIRPDQVHSARTAPEGGTPQIIVRADVELFDALL